VCAQAAGADILATTLYGYTKETRGAELPGLELVRALRQIGCFVICEGGIHAPQAAAEAVRAGADAVVVGTAITNTEWLVREYAAALGQPKSWTP
jgi:N-acylglucosamine-6-phosphate 2-epimerase